MNYQFKVDFIPESFLNKHPDMSNMHPQYLEAMGWTYVEVAYQDAIFIDEVRQNIIDSFEKDGCRVLKIEGGVIE